MSSGREHDIEFTKEPEVKLTAFKTASGAETRGTVKSFFRQGCSRCALMVERELETDANFIFKHSEKTPSYSGKQAMPQQLNETGINYVQGEYIELEELIQENLILALSIYWSPELDGQGNCTYCHLDPSTFSKVLISSEKPATLGALLQDVKHKRQIK
jgi:uncharacterized metal-binding protein YceD (DUF177 family)